MCVFEEVLLRDSCLLYVFKQVLIDISVEENRVSTRKHASAMLCDAELPEKYRIVEPGHKLLLRRESESGNPMTSSGPNRKCKQIAW